MPCWTHEHYGILFEVWINSNQPAVQTAVAGAGEWLWGQIQICNLPNPAWRLLRREHLYVAQSCPSFTQCWSIRPIHSPDLQRAHPTSGGSGKKHNVVDDLTFLKKRERPVWKRSPSMWKPEWGDVGQCLQPSCFGLTVNKALVAQHSIASSTCPLKNNEEANSLLI